MSKIIRLMRKRTNMVPPIPINASVQPNVQVSMKVSLGLEY
jgi:hypothetical protein